MSRGPDWVPLNQRERLSIPHLLAISANQLASNLIWTPIGLLINPMCTEFGIATVPKTFIILLGPIAGLIVPPFAAAFSDRCTMKWGRRRIFLVIGEIMSFVGLMMLAFCDKIGSNSANTAFLVMGQLIVSVGGNIFNGPGRSMCTDLAPESQQVTISNFCQVHSAIAGVLSNAVGAFKLYEQAGMANAQFVLMISCIIGVVALIISIIFSYEEPLENPPPAGKNAFVVVFESFKLYDLPLWLVGLSFFFFQLGANQYNTQIGNFMGMNVFGGDPNAKDGTVAKKLYDDGVSHSQLLALIQTVIQFIFSFVSTYITNAIGLGGTWLFGMLSGVVAQILYFFVMNRYVYIICAVLWSFDQVIGNSVPYSIVSLYADKDSMAGVQSVMVFMGNIAGFLSNFIFTMGLGSVDYFEKNPGKLIAVCFAFTLIAGIVGFFGAKKCEAGMIDKHGLDNDDEKEDVDEKDII